MGSIFDGSGTAPLAAAMCGIEPVWASEIEPYPIKVTKARFPNMKHLGNILDINGAEIEPVDIICGGSPCQDLSVAGKQKGLHEGERSHLFFEMTRIIKEMRDATNGEYPRYIIWENVPGAFSCNNGYDFLAVLQAFAEIAEANVHVPRPENRGKTDRLAWQYAGTVVGDGYSIAWRTVDAQYWGVPQRRRRIYIVADLAGERAGEILFECKGVSGDPEPGEEAREGAANNATGGAGGSGGVKCLNPWDSQTIRQYDASGVYPALSANSGGGQKRDGVVYPNVARTLTAEHDASPCIDRGQNIVVAFMGGQGAKARSIAYCDDGTTPHLRSVNSGSNQVPDVVYSIEGNTIDRASSKNGKGYSEDVAATLNTQDRHGCCDAADCRNGALNEELSGTLQAKPNGGFSYNCINPVVYSSGAYGALSEGVGTLGTGTRATAEMIAVYPQVTGPLMANSHPGSYTGQDAFSDMLPVVTSDKPPRKYIVRRLTPLECCRLQGFPDWWEDGVEGSDSARYKMWGNGMALPNMLHVMRGIARHEGSADHENDT